MNDLKNGILDINGFLISPQTTVEDLENHFQIPAQRNDMFAFWKFNNHAFNNEGISFTVLVTFDENILRRIVLWPQFPDIAAKYDLTPYSDGWLPYFQELRAIMDEWLEKQLGKPTFKDADVTEYSLDKLFIATCAYEDTRHGYSIHGGNLEISYEV